MKAHLLNAACGLLDYAAYPIGMLLVAPVILRNMGAGRYGLWTLATAVVSVGSIVASGFGDANIQHVASLRGAGQDDAALRTVRGMVGINLVLGSTLALLAWILVPYAAPRVAPADLALQRDCLWSLRIASLLIFIRTMESVCISTQRAFERYAAAVRISLTARLLSLGIAALLSCFVHNVAPLLASTALLTLAGSCLQFAHLRTLMHATSLAPIWEGAALRSLMGFGAFTWLQAVSEVVFAQVDRLMLGLSLGAVAVASYALCTQMAQPIYGFAASGLHFLFPYLAGRASSQTHHEQRRAILVALSANVLFVVAASAGLLLLGPHILSAWVGKTIAESAGSLLPPIVLGFALLGLNVTATYALFALGKVRVVTWLNLAGGFVMLGLMIVLLPRLGARGLAVARLGYGAISLLLYLPLSNHLLTRSKADRFAQTTQAVCEEV